MENITSQNAAIRKHLQSGKSITKLEALYSFGSFALNSRISDLRKEGMSIKTTMIEIVSGGKKKHIAKYSLVK